MKNTLIIEEVKRLHEIMGINPKKILLESVGQAWFESLMKDIIEGAARYSDGISDDILDAEAYNAIKPWIRNQVNLANPNENEIKEYLKLINNDLTSGKSLTQIGAGLDWYKLLDDVVKRNESFYTRLIDDMINSGEFKQIENLLDTSQDALKIIKAGDAKNPELYNETIDTLIDLKGAIDESTMDDNLKTIIKNKLSLDSIPTKSKIPIRNQAFDMVAKEIFFKDIPYKNLEKIYNATLKDPEAMILKIQRTVDTFATYVNKPENRFLKGWGPISMMNRTKNALNLYGILWKLNGKNPSYFRYVVASWIIGAMAVCELVQLLKLGYYGLKTGDKELFKFLYGEISDIALNDFYNCTIMAPVEAISTIINYADENIVSKPQDDVIKDKLNELLKKQNNTDYLKFAQSLIDNSGATQKDFEEAGLPTKGLNFGGNGPETPEQILEKWKNQNPNGVVKVEKINDVDTNVYYKTDKTTVGYTYNTQTKTFDL